MLKYNKKPTKFIGFFVLIGVWLLWVHLGKENHMYYLSELIGSIIFLAGGYAYGAQTTLKDTFVKKFNALECALAWGVSLALGIAVATAMGGPAALNPAVLLGLIITGQITGVQFWMLLLMEFLAAGIAVLIVWIFFFENFKDTTEGSKRGIFAAYPVKMNIPVNFLQEAMASCMFIFILFLGLSHSASNLAGPIGALGINSSIVVTVACIIWIAFTYSNTGWSMNPMRSFFSSVWYAILPIQNKNDKVDWKYQSIVNICGSTVGMIIGVVLAWLVKGALTRGGML